MKTIIHKALTLAFIIGLYFGYRAWLDLGLSREIMVATYWGSAILFVLIGFALIYKNVFDYTDVAFIAIFPVVWYLPEIFSDARELYFQNENIIEIYHSMAYISELMTFTAIGIGLAWLFIKMTGVKVKSEI